MGIFEKLDRKEMQTKNGKIIYWVSNTIDGINQPSKKETLIFLHGLTADHRMFELQVRYFLSQYHILCWDNPAHGQSRPYRDFTYAAAADQLRDIMQTEQIEQAVFIGQSMGGYITQTFLKRYPDMVSGFIGIDTCPFGEKYYSRSDKWWLRQVEWMSMCYPHKTLIRAIAGSCCYTEAGRESMRESLLPYTKKELCHLMGIGFAGFLTENCDLKINCPVLILVGEYDKTGKVMQYSMQWNKETGFPLYVIPDAAHNSNVDNSELVNQKIGAFLTDLDK